MSLQTLLLLYSPYLGSSSKYFKVFFSVICEIIPEISLLTPTLFGSVFVTLDLLQVFCPLPVLPSQPPMGPCPLCRTCRLQTFIPLTTDVAALAPALFIRISLLPLFPVIFFCFLSTAYGSRWPLTPLHFFPQHTNCSSFLYLSLVLDPGLEIRVSSMMLLIL